MEVQDLAIKIRVKFSCSDLYIRKVYKIFKLKGMGHARAHKKAVSI